MRTVADLAATRQILKKYGLRLKKGLGQHLLVDSRAVTQIVQAAELVPGDAVVEVGPGIGTLTQALAQSEGPVIALELDRSLLPVLKETCKAYPNVRVVHGDALKLNLDQLVAAEAPAFTGQYKVVANLPYYITTPLMMRFLESGYHIHSLVLMMQREVAMRVLAAPGSKEYGALSIGVQYRTCPSLVTEVPAVAFTPPPEVASAVVRLVVRDAPAVPVSDERLFFALVRAAFGHRRKTLLNALVYGDFGLTKDDWELLLNEVRIDGGRRGESLSLQEFADVCDALWRRRSVQS